MPVTVPYPLAVVKIAPDGILAGTAVNVNTRVVSASVAFTLKVITDPALAITREGAESSGAGVMEMIEEYKLPV